MTYWKGKGDQGSSDERAESVDFCFSTGNLLSNEFQVLFIIYLLYVRCSVREVKHARHHFTDFHIAVAWEADLPSLFTDKGNSDPGKSLLQPNSYYSKIGIWGLNPETLIVTRALLPCP